MIFNMIGTGGGAALNYSIAGGTAAPGSPSANTIWVNTGTAITGHTFAAEAPANPAEGLVWFSVGTDSQVAFAATDTDPIMVYPLSAQQYVSGSWVSREAQSYLNGVWVPWLTYYFDYGRQPYDWAIRTVPFNGIAATNGGGSVTKNSDGSVTLALSNAANQVKSAVYELVSDVDLTEISALHVDWACYYGNSPRQIGVVVFKRTVADPAANSAKKILQSDWSNGSTKDQIKWVNHSDTIDVSALSGMYDIAVGVSCNAVNYGAMVNGVMIKRIQAVRASTATYSEADLMAAYEEGVNEA